MPKVNPNRMELLRLRGRLKTAIRGHKLLKDKLDALVRRFIDLIDEARELRKQVESEIAGSFGYLALARGEAGPLVLTEALSGSGRDISIEVGTANLMSVVVPRFSLPVAPAPAAYSLAVTPPVLDEAVKGFSSALGPLIRLAELEKTIQLLALEIERTRRRVNALEHILIPGLKADIKTINMSLAELERANITRVMKIKDMLETKD